MSEMQRWTDQATAALGIDPSVLAQVKDPVLDMVRDVAHGVDRPSAPLTAFLVGLASGASGSGDAASVERALATVARLVVDWEPAEE